jgi:hypothetical protein
MSKPRRDEIRSAREVKRYVGIQQIGEETSAFPSGYDDSWTPPLSMSMFVSVADYEAELARQANKTKGNKHE